MTAACAGHFSVPAQCLQSLVILIISDLYDIKVIHWVKMPNFFFLIPDMSFVLLVRRNDRLEESSSTFENLIP